MDFPFTISNIIVIILAIAVIALAFMIVQLNAKLKKFLVGNKAESLSDSLSNMNASLIEFTAFRNQLEQYLTTVETRLKKSTQAIHTVRFNPFKGTTGSGGNQSFATALLNESGDGVVVSSLYSREHISVYSKPVKSGASEYELSDEEKEAIAGAMQMLK